MKSVLFASIAAVVLGVLAGAACGTSSSDSATGADGGSDGATTFPDSSMGGIGLDGSVAPDGSYNITFGPQDDPAGEEHTKCIVKRLGNPTSMHVGTVHNVLSPGSHHMIVYRVTDTVEQPTPFDCKPFTDTLDPTKGSTLMISQKHDDALILPDGVAYTLEANQMLRLEMHYINPGATTVPITGTSTFIPIDNAKFKYEADFLFIGTPDIAIPPGGSLTVGPDFIKLPAAYADVNFFALTGHEHQYGKNVLVSTATSAADPGTSVYDVPGWLWSEPATVQADPPFKLPVGGGFKFTCSWVNTSGSEVKFGESANAEMCFFWAYYYPSQGGAKVCAHTDQINGTGGGLDACCPGNSPVCTYLQSGL